MPRTAKHIEDTQEERETALYELGYLLAPSIAQAELDKEIEQIQLAITSVGGTIVNFEEPKMRDLAYTISLRKENIRKDYNDAYFGWIDFTVTSNAVKEIETTLKTNPSIVRYLVLKKDPKDIEHSSARKHKAPDTVDKAIEDLVEESI